MITLSDIQQARERVRGIAVRTPLIQYFPSRGTVAHGQLWLKPENLQPIGAFKIRGAYNKIAALNDEERKRGVITYSSGNHAQGVAYAARALGTKAVIVMPNNAPRLKAEATAALGAEIVKVGPSSNERMQKAQELSQKHGYVIVPPYNDEQIIAGQGTIGLEILEDCPDVDMLLVPCGGGGLLSGIASAIKLSGSILAELGPAHIMAGKVPLATPLMHEFCHPATAAGSRLRRQTELGPARHRLPRAMPVLMHGRPRDRA